MGCITSTPKPAGPIKKEDVSKKEKKVDGSEDRNDNKDNKPQIFISYTWNDTKTDVRAVADALKNSGHFRHVWLDMSGDMKGNKYEAMWKGIEESDVVVIFFNNTYQTRPDCKVEAEAAKVQNKQIVFVKMQPKDEPLTMERWFKAILGGNIWIDYYAEATTSGIEHVRNSILKSVLDLIEEKQRSGQKGVSKAAVKVEIYGPGFNFGSNYTGRPELEAIVKERVKELVSDEPSGILSVYGGGGRGKSWLLRQTLTSPAGLEFLKECGVSRVAWLNVFELTHQVENFDQDAFFDKLAFETFRLEKNEQKANSKTQLVDMIRNHTSGKVLLILDDVFHKKALECVQNLETVKLRIICCSRLNYASLLSSRNFMNEVPIFIDDSDEDFLVAILKKKMLGKASKLKVPSEDEANEAIKTLAGLCAKMPLIAAIYAERFSRMTRWQDLLEYMDKLQADFAKIVAESREDDDKDQSISRILLNDFADRSAEFRFRFYAFLMFDEGAHVDVSDLMVMWQSRTFYEASDAALEMCDLSLARSDPDYAAFNIHSYLFRAALLFACNGETQGRPKINRKLDSINFQDPMWQRSALKLFRPNYLLVVNKCDEKTGENMLHTAITNRLLKNKSTRLVEIIDKAMFEDPNELQLEICKQQTQRDQNSVMHLLAKNPWLKDKGKEWQVNYTLEKACFLADRLLRQSREAKSDDGLKLVTEVKDNKGQSLIQLLLSSVKPDQPWHANALLTSASRECYDLVELLLDSGADVAVKDNLDNTILHIAARSYSNNIIQNVLLRQRKSGSHNLDINARNKSHQTAMMIIAEHNSDLCCQVLIEHALRSATKLDLSAKDVRGNNALHFASCGSKLKVIELFLRYLDAASIINEKNNNEESAIWLAIRSGNIEMAKILYQSGGRLDAGEITVLRLQARFRRQRMVEQLLADSPDVSFKELESALFRLLKLQKVIETPKEKEIIQFSFENNTEALSKCDFATVDAKVNSTALFVASYTGNVDAVRFLLANCKIDPNFKNQEQTSCLMIAGQNGHDGVMKLLLDVANIDISGVDSLGHTILHIVAISGLTDTMRLVMSKSTQNVDVNAVDSKNWTPLMNAALWGFESMVRFLALEAKADVNAVDGNSWTALMMAAQKGHASTIRCLLKEAKADGNLVNSDQWTALLIAAESGHADVVRCLVLDGKLDVNAKDKDHWSGLMLAAQNGHENAVRCLAIELKADVDVLNKSYNTALMLACNNGHLAVVKCLVIEAKANVNVTNFSKWSCLMMAAQGRHAHVVEFLLKETNADINNQDDGGRTALMIGTYFGLTEVCRVLLSYGADQNLTCNQGRTAHDYAKLAVQKDFASAYETLVTSIVRVNK